MDRTRRLGSLLLLAIPFAAALGVSIALAGSPTKTDAEAQRAAFDALHLTAGDCVSGADVSRRRYTPEEIDLRVKSTTGWFRGYFVGAAEDLAAEVDGSVVSSTLATAWVLVGEGTSSRAVYEFAAVTLPSGRTAWSLGGGAQAAACD